MKLVEFSLFLLIIALTIYAEVVDAQRHRRKQGPPNFVLLFVDDLGYGDLGFTGHPTTKTPNIDKLAYNGKVLTTWYSGCNVCTGSRAALMTGRQFPRTGLPGVLGPTGKIGLNRNETTIAEQLKSKGGYTTAIIGKWHLGQRNVYLPANRGFDYYLGIPYSDDMGKGYESSCPATQKDTEEVVEEEEELEHYDDEESNNNNPFGSYDSYKNGGFLEALMNDTSKGNTIINEELLSLSSDPAGQWLPLVYQDNDQTRVLEQPLDYTTLAEKYNSFALDFIEKSKDEPFFLYMPFSHVHATSSTPKLQYAGCNFKKSTKRGAFGDALAEADWIVGNIMQKLRDSGLEEDTLILFTSDNGPWLNRGVFSGGSEGLFTGRFGTYFPPPPSPPLPFFLGHFSILVVLVEWDSYLHSSFFSLNIYRFSWLCKYRKRDYVGGWDTNACFRLLARKDYSTQSFGRDCFEFGCLPDLIFPGWLIPTCKSDL